MHELGITQSIVDIVAERAAGATIRRVTLEIGKLSAVLPDAIRFCFEICAQGSECEGAQLEIIEVPGWGRCRICATELPMNDFLATCACGSVDLECIAGQELKLKEMEVA